MVHAHLPSLPVTYLAQLPLRRADTRRAVCRGAPGLGAVTHALQSNLSARVEAFCFSLPSKVGLVRLIFSRGHARSVAHGE